MAKTNTYPELTFDVLFDVYNVGQNMRRDPAYLEESPYPEIVKKTLKSIFSNESQQVVTQENSPITAINIADLNIKQETEYLYLETKQLLQSKILDEKDKAAIIKTATGQMEKLITLIEKANDLRQIREFEVKVLKALKKVVPEVREKFLDEIERLEKEDGNKL